MSENLNSHVEPIPNDPEHFNRTLTGMIEFVRTHGDPGNAKPREEYDTGTPIEKFTVGSLPSSYSDSYSAEGLDPADPNVTYVEVNLAGEGPSILYGSYGSINVTSVAFMATEGIVKTYEFATNGIVTCQDQRYDLEISDVYDDDSYQASDTELEELSDMIARLRPEQEVRASRYTAQNAVSQDDTHNYFDY